MGLWDKAKRELQPGEVGNATPQAINIESGGVDRPPLDLPKGWEIEISYRAQNREGDGTAQEAATVRIVDYSNRSMQSYPNQLNISRGQWEKVRAVVDRIMGFADSLPTEM